MAKHRDKIVRDLLLEVFIHATESEERVREALEHLLGVCLEEELSREVLHGYHGNPVVILRYRCSGAEAQRGASHILSSLDKFDAEEIARSIEDRILRGKLYIRLDKQDAYLGEARLSNQDDVVRAVITFYPHIRGREKILWALRKLGLRYGEET